MFSLLVILILLVALVATDGAATRGDKSVD